MSKYNTIVCKNSQGSWEARTHIPLPFKLEYRGKQFDAELSIVTFRRGSVELSTAASVHRIEDRGIRSHQLCEDFYSVLESDRTITRVTEKAVSGLHAKSVHETYVNILIRKVADFYKVQWPAAVAPVVEPSDAPPVRSFVFGSEFQPPTYDDMVVGIRSGLKGSPSPDVTDTDEALVLYGVDDFPIYVDACVRDEESNLLFASFYGRDTAIKELMARLAIESGELSLKNLTLRCLSGKREGQTVSVYIRDSSSLQKMTGRLPKGLFGEMTHLQVFHPSIQAQQGAKVAWLLENANPSSITAEYMRQRIWKAVCEMAPIPMFDNWCEPVLNAIWDDSVFEMGKKIEREDVLPRFSEPIGNMAAFRVVLRDDFPTRVSKLIRDGVIGLPVS